MLLVWSVLLLLPLCSGNFDVPIDRSWPGGFETKMCVSITAELHSWKLHLISDLPISSLNSGGAQIQKVGDEKEHILTNRQWDAEEHVGDTMCFKLIGATKGSRVPTLTAFIEGMESTNGPTTIVTTSTAKSSTNTETTPATTTSTTSATAGTTLSTTTGTTTTSTTAGTTTTSTTAGTTTSITTGTTTTSTTAGTTTSITTGTTTTSTTAGTTTSITTGTTTTSTTAGTTTTSTTTGTTTTSTTAGTTTTSTTTGTTTTSTTAGTTTSTSLGTTTTSGSVTTVINAAITSATTTGSTTATTTTSTVTASETTTVTPTVSTATASINIVTDDFTGITEDTTEVKTVPTNFDVPIDRSWPGGFETNMCVSITAELHSWKLHLMSDVPINSLNSGGAQIQKVGGGKEHILTNRQWDAEEHVGDTMCFKLIGATTGDRVPTLKAFIEGMESTNGPKGTVTTVISAAITSDTTTATTAALTSAITTTSTAKYSTVTVSETNTETPTIPTATASVNIGTDGFTGNTKDTGEITTAPTTGEPYLQGFTSPVSATGNPFALLCKEYGLYCASTSASEDTTTTATEVTTTTTTASGKPYLQRSTSATGNPFALLCKEYGLYCASTSASEDTTATETEVTTTTTTATGKPSLQRSASPVPTSGNPFALLCKEYGVYCTSTLAAAARRTQGKQSTPA